MYDESVIFQPPNLIVLYYYFKHPKYMKGSVGGWNFVNLVASWSLKAKIVLVDLSW